MFYSPHILQVRNDAVTYDSLGQSSVSDCWLDVGSCRCDKTNSQIVGGDAGLKHQSSFHIVADKVIDAVSEGDRVRCADKQGKIIAEGIVTRVNMSNVFNLMELWV